MLQVIVFWRMDRPKRGEDENELLRFQQEFLASKDVPSVTIVKKADKRKPESQDRDVVKMDGKHNKIEQWKPYVHPHFHN